MTRPCETCGESEKSRTWWEFYGARRWLCRACEAERHAAGRAGYEGGVRDWDERRPRVRVKKEAK